MEQLKPHNFYDLILTMTTHNQLHNSTTKVPSHSATGNIASIVELDETVYVEASSQPTFLTSPWHEVGFHVIGLDESATYVDAVALWIRVAIHVSLFTTFIVAFGGPNAFPLPLYIIYIIDFASCIFTGLTPICPTGVLASFVSLKISFPPIWRKTPSSFLNNVNSAYLIITVILLINKVTIESTLAALLTIVIGFGSAASKLPSFYRETLSKKKKEDVFTAIELIQNSKEETFSIQVMVVDDVAVNVKLMKKTLVSLGVDEGGIVTCMSGEEACEMRGSFDVIFLDHEMDGINGSETACRLIKSGYRGIIVGVTANAEWKSRFLTSGAERVILKPAKRSELKSVLNSVKGFGF